MLNSVGNGKCPSSEELVLYAEDWSLIDVPVVIRIDDHLKKCAHCRFKMNWLLSDPEE